MSSKSERMTTAVGRIIGGLVGVVLAVAGEASEEIVVSLEHLADEVDDLERTASKPEAPADATE